MSYHVLVVEDDAVTRSKLAGYFQNEGYRVSEAESGAEMRDILGCNEIDLVMLDINLPGEDGLMLTRELRSCLLYTSPSPRDGLLSRMPSSA